MFTHSAGPRPYSVSLFLKLFTCILLWKSMSSCYARIQHDQPPTRWSPLARRIDKLVLLYCKGSNSAWRLRPEVYTSTLFPLTSDNVSLQIRNCDIYYIGLDAVDVLGKLDYFGIEGGSIDGVEPNAFASLSVERLAGATHAVSNTLHYSELKPHSRG